MPGGGGGSWSWRGWRPGWQPPITRSHGASGQWSEGFLRQEISFGIPGMCHVRASHETGKNFMLLKRNVLEISLGDILISWHQKSCSQTIRMTICFRWWKISWWLWLRQTGLTTIYCLLFCLWNMFWMWQASGRGERGRGPLINFDCEWNFQFCLRLSGKMEACDSLTGLSVSWVSHRKPFLLVRSGSGRQVLWWLLTKDQRALNCHVVCVGSGVSGDIVMSAPLLTTEILSDSPGPRHWDTGVFESALIQPSDPTRVVVRRCQIDLLQFPKILAVFRVTSSDGAILSTRGAIHRQRQKIGLTLG